MKYILSMLLILSSTPASSETCTDTTGWEEEIDCLNNTLDVAESDVERIYKRVITGIKEDLTSEDKPILKRAKEMLDLVIKSQEMWSSYRNHVCDNLLEVAYRGGSYAGQSQLRCRIHFAEERLKWLSVY